MTNNELKRLSRKELLEMLIEQSKEIERLNVALKASEEKLKSKEITIENSGTVIEAAFALNGVFDSVKAASEQYLENIRKYCYDKQKDYDQVISEAKEKAEKIIAEAEMEKERKMREANNYVKRVSSKLVEFYQRNPEEKSEKEAEDAAEIAEVTEVADNAVQTNAAETAAEVKVVAEKSVKAEAEHEKPQNPVTQNDSEDFNSDGEKVEDGFSYSGDELVKHIMDELKDSVYESEDEKVEETE